MTNRAARIALAFLVCLSLTARARGRDTVVFLTPNNAAGILSDARSGNLYLFAPGEYTLPFLTIPPNVTLSRQAEGNVIVRPQSSADANESWWTLSDDVQIQRITFLGVDGSLAGPAFSTVPGAHIEIGECRFVGFKEQSILSAESPGHLTFDRTSFFRVGRILSLSGGIDTKLSVRSCEALMSPGSEEAAFEIEGPAKVEISGSRFIGGQGVLSADAPTSVTIVGCTLHSQKGTGIAIRKSEADVTIRELLITGEFGNAAILVAGDPTIQGDRPYLRITEIEARDASVRPTSPGLIAVLAPEGFELSTLDKLHLSGYRGTAIQVLSRSYSGESRTTRIRFADSTIAGWDTGIDFSSRGDQVVKLQFLKPRNRLLGNGRGLTVSGKNAHAELKFGTEFLANGTGLLVEEDANLDAHSLIVKNSIEAAIDVATSGTLKLRGTRIEGGLVGIRIREDAGPVDLGTRKYSGRNEFITAGPAAFAILLEKDIEIPAYGNEWIAGDLEVTAAEAIDDMIDDGDTENPLGETGRGEVLFEPPAPNVQTRALTWDLSATRQTPGFGQSVFRDYKSIESRLDSLETIRLGPGTYPVPPLTGHDLTLRGTGPAYTTLVAPEGIQGAVVRSGARTLTLIGMTIQLGDSAAPADTAIDWSGGNLELKRVSIEGVVGTAIRATPGKGRIGLSDVTIVEAEKVAHSAPSPGALLDLSERTVDLSASTLRTSHGRTAFQWVPDDENARLWITESTIDVRGNSESPAVVLGGSSQIERLDVRTESTVALKLEPNSNPTLLIARDVNLMGFTEMGLSLGSGDCQILWLSGSIEATSNTASVATGFFFPPGSNADLALMNLTATNVRPGIDLQGGFSRILMDQTRWKLEPGFNAIAGREDAIRFSLKPHPKNPEYAEPIQLLRTRVSGYDNAIHLTAAHEDPTTVTVGNYTPTGVNRLVGNEVAIRLSSPTGALHVREDRNRALISENGVGVLVEDGALLLENAVLTGNQAGVIVRGGVADLGSGPLGGRGGNVLWPQAGAHAIMNETVKPIWAIRNFWGDASLQLETSEAPILDKRKNESYGPVITRRE